MRASDGSKFREGGGGKGGGFSRHLCLLENGDETQELTEEEQNELGEKQVVHIHIVFVYQKQLRDRALCLHK